MKRQDVLQFYPQLKLLLRQLKLVNLSFITLIIILYMTAAYCLLKGQMVAAVVLATFAFLLFHFTQKYILLGLKFFLYREKNNREMLSFLDKEMQLRLDKTKGTIKRGEEVKDFFLLLDKVMQAVDQK